MAEELVGVEQLHVAEPLIFTGYMAAMITTILPRRYDA
jgi:hypothetical protein